jgi:beta-galactosidase
MDPTRRCTVPMNGSWGNGFSKVIDVQGFNYLLNNMDRFHSSFSNQPAIGTETASLVSDRGIYADSSKDGFMSGYDIRKRSVGWGQPAEQWWPFFNSRPWSSGGFAWTGFDYRGEPTPYYNNFVNVSSHFGTIDTCGFFKDIAYYYQANWTVKPVLHLFPHWNWLTVGQPIKVWAFGNCETVELFTNGVSLGRQTLNVQGHIEWNVPYAPGILQAVGYRFGEPVITNTIVTTGAPAGIVLTPDRNTILADGRDVSVITVAVRDAKGNIVPTATNEISFAIKGGTIIGVGNGNPSSHEPDKASQRSVFNGLAQIIVQSTAKAGRITLTATSPDLKSTKTTLTAATKLPPPAAPTGVSAVGSDGQITVSWDIVPGAITYNLFRSTKPGGPYTPIAQNIGGVSLGFVDHSVTNGTKYYYGVSANGNGKTSKSAEIGTIATAR